MAKVFANVCAILNAVLNSARDVRHFAFCVQCLNCVYSKKKKEATFLKCV